MSDSEYEGGEYDGGGMVGGKYRPKGLTKEQAFKKFKKYLIKKGYTIIGVDGAWKREEHIKKVHKSTAAYKKRKQPSKGYWSTLSAAEKEARIRKMQKGRKAAAKK